MTQPAFVLDGAMDALNAVSKSISRARLPIPRPLIHMRASQINGCSLCLDMHAKEALEAGESLERVIAVGAWRDTTFFTDAERAALELTEELTRLADRPDQVPDELWDRLTEHFDETQLAALVLDIASINVWNRLNIATRQVIDGSTIAA
jgi:AhpD family alkylhydroperoxidase